MKLDNNVKEQGFTKKVLLQRNREIKFINKAMLKVMLLVTLLFSSVNAFANMFNPCPYVGVDYKVFWTKGRGTFFHSVFPESYPGGTAYAGTKFNTNFGLEIAYNRTSVRHKTRLINNVSVKTGVRFTSYSLDANLYLPIIGPWEAIISLGAAPTKAKITTFSPPNRSVQTKAENPILRIGIGGQYYLTQEYGIRAMGRYEGTVRLQQGNFHPFKDGLSAALGFFVRFF